MTRGHCLSAFRKRGSVQILSRTRPSHYTELRSSLLRALHSNTGTPLAFQYGSTDAACLPAQGNSALQIREFFLIGSTPTCVAGRCVMSVFRRRECRCETRFIPLI